jgi:hypothetical protein
MNLNGPIQQWVGPLFLTPFMHIRYLTVWLLVGLLMALAGCGGGNDPVNEGKDKPVPAKKDK